MLEQRNRMQIEDDPFQIPRLPPMYFEVLAPDLPLSSLQSMSDVLRASLVPLGPFISLLETLLGVGRPVSGGATATHSHTDEKEQTNRMLIDRETVPCVLSPLSTGSQVVTAFAGQSQDSTALTLHFFVLSCMQAIHVNLTELRLKAR